MMLTLENLTKVGSWKELERPFTKYKNIIFKKEKEKSFEREYHLNEWGLPLRRVRWSLERSENQG